MGRAAHAVFAVACLVAVLSGSNWHYPAHAAVVKPRVYGLFTYEGSVCYTFTSITTTSVAGGFDGGDTAPSYQFTGTAYVTGRTGRARDLTITGQVGAGRLTEHILLTPAVLWIVVKKSPVGNPNDYMPQDPVYYRVPYSSCARWERDS